MRSTAVPPGWQEVPGSAAMQRLAPEWAAKPRGTSNESPPRNHQSTARRDESDQRVDEACNVVEAEGVPIGGEGAGLARGNA